MKKVLLLLNLAILLVAHNSVAQILTAKEMIEKTKCQSFDCYNNFIITKNFGLYSTKGLTAIDRMYTYNSADGQFTSSFGYDSDKKRSTVTFYTTDEKVYQLVLGQFAAKDFHIVTTNVEQGRRNAVYESTKYPGITLISIIGINKIEKLDGMEIKDYSLLVQRD